MQKYLFFWFINHFYRITSLTNYKKNLFSSSSDKCVDEVSIRIAQLCDFVNGRKNKVGSTNSVYMSRPFVTKFFDEWGSRHYAFGLYRAINSLTSTRWFIEVSLSIWGLYLPVCTNFEMGFGFQFLVLFSINRGEKTSRSNTFCESYKLHRYALV